MNSNADWLVMLGLYETARILYPEEAGHFTDGYIEFIMLCWY